MHNLKITNQDRGQIAQAWREAKAMGEDQRSFCARQVPPISPRTLRLWCHRFPSETPDPGSDIWLVMSALANLQLLADALAAHNRPRAPRCRDAAAAFEELHHPDYDRRDAIDDEPAAGMPIGNAAHDAPRSEPKSPLSFWDDEFE